MCELPPNVLCRPGASSTTGPNNCICNPGYFIDDGNCVMCPFNTKKDRSGDYPCTLHIASNNNISNCSCVS